MEQYCVNCGEAVRPDAVFCPHCGQKTAPSVHSSDEWAEFGNFLGRLSLSLAKGLLYLIMGGIALACGMNGVGMLVMGAILLYHFASGGICVLSPALASAIGVERLSGAPLAIGGITAAFIALLFAAAAVSLVRAILALRAQGRPQAV